MNKTSQARATKKYKIEDCLNQLNHHQYRFARRVLPRLIGKCQNTLNNYINITIDSKEELPYTIGVKLERFFGLEPGNLINDEVVIEHYSVMFNKWNEDASDLNNDLS